MGTHTAFPVPIVLALPEIGAASGRFAGGDRLIVQIANQSTLAGT